MSIYSNTNYVIFNVSELDKVNFGEVLEDNKETVRRSVDGTKTFVNWWGQTTPTFVSTLTTAEGIYKYDDILPILTGSDVWNLRTIK